MAHAEQNQNQLRRMAEHYQRQVQLARNQQEDENDEGPHEAAAIVNASVLGLCLWATAIGTGYLLLS
jgi:hypothetical protein